MVLDDPVSDGPDLLDWDVSGDGLVELRFTATINQSILSYLETVLAVLVGASQDLDQMTAQLTSVAELVGLRILRHPDPVDRFDEGRPVLASFELAGVAPDRFTTAGGSVPDEVVGPVVALVHASLDQRAEARKRPSGTPKPPDLVHELSKQYLRPLLKPHGFIGGPATYHDGSHRTRRRRSAIRLSEKEASISSR